MGDAVALETFARRFLGHYLTLSPSPLHRWLSEELGILPWRRGTMLNVLAPRGAAKSTWLSLALPLWCAVEGMEPYIVLTADTTDQAGKYLDAVRAELEGNEDLCKAYPHSAGVGPVWRGDRLRLPNGALFEALGTGMKIRGRRNRSERPSLIICDDPQNTEHMISALQRERSWEWLVKDVLNAGTPETNIVVAGTALHRECIVCRLQHTAGWRSRSFAAIVSWPDRMDLWKEWEATYNDHENPEREVAARAYYQANRASMDAGSAALWPEREDLYKLMCLRATIGSAAFASEKQGDPVNPDLCEWGNDYFDYPGFWFDQWPERLAIKTLALDPSKGKDSKVGDYSAYVRYGRDGAGYEYVEADVRRRATDAIVADGVEHVRQFQPDGFAVETNTFQELFVTEFRREGQRLRIDLPLYGLENTVNKIVRIRRLGPPLAQRRLRFKARSPGTALLIQQLRDFPVADFDDAADALEMSRRLAIELHNAKVGPGPSRLTA